ncbi:DNA cytosine methyltransferase [Natronoglycomyces albus]|uniref:DNA (cytosine-5-)-methyltransferase n=1 Tax=Natronoglycomyces albus TaxID=2811108 RepID=A0A895XQW9_9ACTN|nr:DNA (cytosine-5-)-methyltransferase [Natronoglycomyces albus]
MLSTNCRRSTIASVTDAPCVPKISPAASSSTGLQAFEVAEFFAGIGLARLGLENAGFRVTWANDIERAKWEMYLRQFGDAAQGDFHLGDITDVRGTDIPEGTSLAWASFPCTDLSLAGGRGGLAGKQSGTFWQLVRVLKEIDYSRPAIVALENVNGLATSHKGADLSAAISALNQLGYSVDIMTIDARRFVPQSRPRLFIVAVQHDVLSAAISAGLPLRPTHTGPQPFCVTESQTRPKWLSGFFENQDLETHRFDLRDLPPLLDGGLTTQAEEMRLSDERWWSEERIVRFVAELSDVQKARLDDLTMNARSPIYRSAYRRTRKGKPAWEIRADDIAGCLRTARGGSSKQAIVRIQRGSPLRARWMTPIEYARLMGASSYVISDIRKNQALFGFGDAVCVPVVEWLGHNYFRPILAIASAGTVSSAP